MRLSSLFVWIHSRWESIASTRINRYRLRGLKYRGKQLEQVLRRMHAYEDEIEHVHNLVERLAIAAKIERLHQVAISLDAMTDEETR